MFVSYTTHTGQGVANYKTVHMPVPKAAKQIIAVDILMGLHIIHIGKQKTERLSIKNMSDT